MNGELIQREFVDGSAAGSLPAIVRSAGEAGAMRFLEFFTANIRNVNTRRAYYRATAAFFDWLRKRGVVELRRIQPLHVSAYVEDLQREHSKPSVKQALAAIRMLFDWLVTGQIIPTNPAHAVRGPRYSIKTGKTPVLTTDETRQLLDSIPSDSVVGIRDRALIALMVYTFARVGAAVGMNVDDYYPQGRRWWVRLNEKGGKHHEMPAHHRLDEYLGDYVEAAGIEGEKKTPLFRTAAGRTGALTLERMTQADVYRMIRRRATEASINTPIGCHTFRATGITAYLRNGGRLEIAQQMAGHESARTTGLYDRRDDNISLDEVERIAI